MRGGVIAAFIAVAGVKPGASRVFGKVMDVVPTFLDLAGLAAPRGEFAGRSVRPMLGKSWAPYLAGRALTVHAADEAVGGELFGGRALSHGDWTLVNLGAASGSCSTFPTIPTKRAIFPQRSRSGGRH